MMRDYEDRVVACIADFEVTFIIDHAEFTTHKVAGPARWTAPEILDPPSDSDPAANIYTRETDIFAFAMTIFEIFAGNRPFFETRNDSAVIFKILGDQRPTLSPEQFKSQAVRDIITKAWDKDRTSRPTATAIIAVLKTAQRNLEPSLIYSFISYIISWITAPVNYFLGPSER